jgi:hypothetical protein
LLAAAVLAAGAGPASAEPAVGITKLGNSLAVLDTSSPGAFKSVVPVTGLTPGERLADIDWRHHPDGSLNPLPPPQLFGLGVVDDALADTIHLYTIDIASGAATMVGSGATVGGADRYGMDFSPTVDQIRVVDDADANFRLNPNTGAMVTADTDLNPPGGKVTSVAYDRVDIPTPPVVPDNTTAYAISLSSETLVTIGDVNGTPQSANGGHLLNAKPLGLMLGLSSTVGFDISPSGAAFATLEDGATGLPGVYTVDLGTGAATLLGTLPEALSSIAIIPQSALPTAPDTTPPGVVVGGVKKKLSFDAFLKGVSAKVTPSEPASLTGELLGAAKKKSKARRLAAFTRVLAKKSLGLASGQRTLKLKPKKGKVGRPKKKFKVRLKVTATDAAGNAGAATRTITVKPPKKKKKPKR